MGKISRSSNSNWLNHRASPYPVSRSYCWESPEKCNLKRKFLMERKEWEEATCSVCMEFPHNAVLLLCSSHDKGCRPYMCGTSYRHSNCLDQFKTAYTKVRRSQSSSMVEGPGLSFCRSSEALELACPLCRGQVKGWTVVEPARKFLNKKKRSCMQDDCSFVGTYKELKRHVKYEHPLAKPWQIDPELEEKWRTLELEREREDVISTIRSSMPRSVLYGDYVIEMTSGDDEGDDDGHVNFRGRRGMGILYFFLREGARLMRLQREGGFEGDAGASGYDIPLGGIHGGVDVAAATTGRWRRMGLLRAGRQHRRRRHRVRGEPEI
ncbi:hypothetical protein HPP92_009298 [Vanilla planifolia]|uniref:Uncharacterized protein n=1 Tax=Vanilla planifolia TaxID=51239 RepID=A0A835RCI3_VANPL|nr:hypothetical protein HPP92_009509 [Vanilla planifolia]KAG0487203.1 hypothetical protein HPP92_009298 [Vanilla planifolia]